MIHHNAVLVFLPQSSKWKQIEISPRISPLNYVFLIFSNLAYVKETPASLDCTVIIPPISLLVRITKVPTYVISQAAHLLWFYTYAI
jgi:hypothetical protein